MEAVTALLAELNLGEYAGALDDFGIATLDDLRDEDLITDADFVEMGMKKAHVPASISLLPLQAAIIFVTRLFGAAPWLPSTGMRCGRRGL